MLRYNDKDAYNSKNIDKNAKKYLDDESSLDTSFYILNNEYTSYDNIIGKRESVDKCKFTSTFKSENEKVICRCFYKLSRKNKCTICPHYGLMNKYVIDSYEVLDYELPTARGSKRNVDLILKDNEGKVLFVEVKPKCSDESLLRMCFEILTYTSVLNYWISKKNEQIFRYLKEKLNLKEPFTFSKAIMFFKGSKQEEIWNDCNSEIYTKQIIKNHSIDVLCIEENERKKYSIKKVN